MPFQRSNASNAQQFPPKKAQQVDPPFAPFRGSWAHECNRAEESAAYDLAPMSYGPHIPTFSFMRKSLGRDALEQRKGGGGIRDPRVCAPNIAERVQGNGSKWRSANWRRPLQTKTRHSVVPPPPPPVWRVQPLPPPAPQKVVRGGNAIFFREHTWGPPPWALRHPVSFLSLLGLLFPLYFPFLRGNITPFCLHPVLLVPPVASASCTPLCDIPSGCCSFTGPWTARSSLRMLRRVAAFCRPLRPVLLLVSFPRSRSPVVGVLGLC